MSLYIVQMYNIFSGSLQFDKDLLNLRLLYFWGLRKLGKYSYSRYINIFWLYAIRTCIALLINQVEFFISYTTIL